MGNRAVLSFPDHGLRNGETLGIYVHWNGGRASVEGFLAAARDLGLTKDPDTRTVDLIADLVSPIVQTPGKLKAGPLSMLDCDNFDNGVYIIDRELTISGRAFVPVRDERPYREENDAEKTNGIRDYLLKCANERPVFLAMLNEKLNPESSSTSPLGSW